MNINYLQIIIFLSLYLYIYINNLTLAKCDIPTCLANCAHVEPQRPSLIKYVCYGLKRVLFSYTHFCQSYLKKFMCSAYIAYFYVKVTVIELELLLNALFICFSVVFLETPFLVYQSFIISSVSGSTNKSIYSGTNSAKY